MNTKHKHYPHPVLESQFNEPDQDFVNSSFDVSITSKLNENKSELILETIFDLSNNTLRSLIDSKKATFAILLVCESTSTRILKQTFQYEERFHIPTKSLNKTVMIYPYVLAKKDIQNYRNEDLIEPINNLFFQIKRGDILAIAISHEVYIEKEALFEAGSIFEFVETKKKNAPLMSFNPDNPKIQIWLPSATFYKVKEFSNFTGHVNHILISLLYVPAVIYALQIVLMLNRDSDEETKLLEFKDYNWYRTLERKLIDLKLGEDLTEIREERVIDIAHRLMENPYEKAFSALEELFFEPEEVSE